MLDDLRGWMVQKSNMKDKFEHKPAETLQWKNSFFQMSVGKNSGKNSGKWKIPKLINVYVFPLGNKDGIVASQCFHFKFFARGSQKKKIDLSTAHGSSQIGRPVPQATKELKN